MDLDSMLKDLGQFGKYQAFCFTVLMFPVILCGCRTTDYVFSMMNIPHRCRVPECEGPEAAEFHTPWLQAAIPFTEASDGTFPQECLRYRPLFSSEGANQTFCSADNFNHSETIVCNDWVFSENTRTMATDFKIVCPEDRWKLTLLSSIAVIFSFIGIPLSGYLADRFGRKNVMVSGCVVLSMASVIQSFSVGYRMSIIVEAFYGVFGATVYGPAFILGLETLSPSKRLLGSLLINVYFTLGEMLLAVVMWATGDWRLTARVLYIPGILLAVNHWLLPESVRWLYTRNRLEEIEQIFKRMAKMNNTEDKLPGVLNLLYSKKVQDKNPKPNGTLENRGKVNKMKLVLKSRIVMLRVVALSVAWVASIFTYYGISQYMTLFDMSNRYLSYLLVSLVEMPAYVASLWLPDWPLLGRRGTTAWSFFLIGLVSFMLTFLTHAQEVLSIILFLIAKFASTMTITVLYVYTAEVFPTELRQTLLSLCSMVGRSGGILSQQIPLIRVYINPTILFSLIAILGGIFTLMCPETLNTALPNTIEEAEKIGKTQSDKQPHVSSLDCQK